MVKKYKFLILLFLLIISLFLLSSRSFAYTYEYDTSSFAADDVKLIQQISLKAKKKLIDNDVAMPKYFFIFTLDDANMYNPETNSGNIVVAFCDYAYLGRGVGGICDVVNFKYLVFRSSNDYLTPDNIQTFNDGAQNLWYGSLRVIYTNFEGTGSDLVYYAKKRTTDDLELFQGSLFVYPYITNSVNALSTGNFDYIFVDYGDLNTVDNIGMTVWQVKDDYDVQLFSKDSTHSYIISGSKFLYQTNSHTFYYSIPSSFTGITYQNGVTYKIILDNGLSYFDDDYSIYNEVVFTVNGITSEQQAQQNADKTTSAINEQTKTIKEENEKTQNAINAQTEVIKENNETNKNIFQKIGDILSFINPFSENFFGRKLVELIINGLKSLFIPEDGFFSDYFTELKDWFSERFGFLWAPFDFIIDLLTRIVNINFSEPVFSIPDINEPFTGHKLISAIDFNFNDLLENQALKTVHDIYLLIVDGGIVFALYKITREKIEEVFTK